MTLTELRYWQWLAIAIMAALLAVLAHRWSGQDAGAASIPANLSGQEERFERALSGRVQGQPLLRKIAVYPRQITSADGRTARPVHLVTAQYCAGIPEQYNGARRFVWRDSIFVFPIPYHPTPDLAQFDPALAAAFAKRATRAGGNATVLDLLAAARSVHGMGYSYAWWDAHFSLLAGGGCLVLLGVILPNVLHLARFGQLKPARKRKTRTAAPAVADSISPSSAGAATAQAAVAASAASSGEDSPPRAIEDGPPASPSIVPALNAAPIEPTPHSPTSSCDPSEFGMNRDDYYPTVRHHPDATPAERKVRGG